MTRALVPFARRLRDNASGVAMLEFGFMVPIFVLMCVGGSELTNFITVKMRMSQIALQIADNAARIGSGSPLAAKVITETDVNDVFIGAQLESGLLNLRTNGRVFLSNVEPDPANAGKYRITWQRCYGLKTALTRQYGAAGDSNRAFFGPDNKRAMALPDNATMMVELRYQYRPLIKTAWVPEANIVEVASMAVRDRRNLNSAPNNTAGATIATC